MLFHRKKWKKIKNARQKIVKPAEVAYMAYFSA